MSEQNMINPETNNKDIEQYNRLMSIFHIGTDVKRNLLDHYLRVIDKQLYILDWLASQNTNFLLFEDVKHALRKSSTITVKDLVLSTIDTILKCYCFDMFWDCCLLNKSLEDILNSHKDRLYRIYVNSNNQNETKSFTKDQWDIMFKRGENIKMEGNESEQCLSASKGITVSRLDNTMNLLILSVVCPLFKSVNVVSECQTQISKIAVLQRKVTGREFADIWDKLEEHIDKISSHCQLSICFMDECSIVKKAIFNRSQIRQNRKPILEDALINHNFIKDTQFCNRARKELEILILENNLNCAKAYCGKDIPVPLINGQYRKGTYPHSVLEQAENDLGILISVSTNQGMGESQEEKEEFKGKIKTHDLKEKGYNHNHLKIVQLITGIGTHALVDVLKLRLPSANFGYFFNGMKRRLALLLDEREYQLLYPDNSKYNGDLSDLDISLLYIILRNLNTITPHENRWGNSPNTDDRCLSANIDRIRFFKNNFVSHCSKYSLNEEDFLKTWKEISQCIIELGGEEYNQKVDVLFTSAINPLIELELICNAREKLEESKRDARKVILLKERNDSIKLNLNITKGQQIDNVNQKTSDDPSYKATQRASNRATQGTKTPSSPMDTTLLYCRSDSDSASTTTEETTAKANTTNLPSGDNLQPGNIPLVLSLYGKNIPTVKECRERIQNIRTPEVHITFVKEGSIIIGLDVAPPAFHNVGHFIAIIDTLVSILLQGYIQKRNEHSSYVVVSLDFLDRDNEPLTSFQPYLMEDEGCCLEKDEATDFKEELNGNCKDFSYKKEHLCTTEDLKEQYENMITKRSSKEIQSKVLKIKGQAKGTTFGLDKSSGIFRPENQMESTPTKIADKTAKQDAIYKLDIEELEGAIELSTKDCLMCGHCSHAYTSIDMFMEHKKTHTPRQRADYIDVIEYTMNAFPRLQEHQQNLNACVQMDEVRDKLQTYLAQYPCALFYCGNVDKQINVFYQRNLRKIQTIKLSPELNTAAHGTSMPNVFLCVLRGKYGHLSNIDTVCLQKMKKELPGHWIDKTLFVVTAKSFFGSLRNFHTLSYEISKELGLDMKTLTFRIFKDKDEDIFKRMSLYFEQDLVEKRYDVSRYLHSLGSYISLVQQYTLSSKFTINLTQTLLAGPLGFRLLDILKNASRAYEWRGELFARNKVTVTEAADKIARFACEKLGKEIAETLIRHFDREMLLSNHDFSFAICQYINLNDIGSTVLKDIFLILFSLFFGPVGWLISAIIILFSETEINSTSFRDEVACEMETQIHQHKDQILLDVIQKFRSDVRSRLKAIRITLENSDINLRRLFSEKEHLIRKGSIEHEFKTIAAKHELIRNFKFDDDTLKIYASGNEENYEDVKDFVDAYFRPDVKTEVFMDQNTEGI